ncbi:MAG: hypothetical protein GYA57_04340 [Myxococcales bacterium]|nr:hypothetical protein [Myxococcales bacterium]
MPARGEPPEQGTLRVLEDGETGRAEPAEEVDQPAYREEPADAPGGVAGEERGGDAAAEEDEGSERRFRGPLEMVQGFHTLIPQRIGSPRAAVPESRIGAFVVWKHWSGVNWAREVERIETALVLIEGQIALPRNFEVALESMLYERFEVDVHEDDVSGTDEVFADVLLRAKWDFASGSWFDVAATLEGSLWSGFGDTWTGWWIGVGFHAAFRPHEIVTINVSLPTFSGFSDDGISFPRFGPGAGLAVTPWTWLGFVVDFQALAFPVYPPWVHYRLDFGVRSRPTEEFLIEVVGLVAPEEAKVEGGVAARIAWTPADFF